MTLCGMYINVGILTPTDNNYSEQQQRIKI